MNALVNDTRLWRGENHKNTSNTYLSILHVSTHRSFQVDLCSVSFTHRTACNAQVVVCLNVFKRNNAQPHMTLATFL